MADGADRDRWVAVDARLESALGIHDEVLRATLDESDAAGLPPIAISPLEGRLLQSLARMIGARRILEIGTLGGYSTIWMGRALPPDGRLVTLELDPHHADVARRNIERAGLGDRVEVRVGRAADSLAVLETEAAEPFDLVFIDADKRSNPDYLEAFRRAYPQYEYVLWHHRFAGQQALLPACDDGRRVGTRSVRADAVGSEQRLGREHLAEEPLGGVEVTVGRKQEVDGRAVLVDGPVEVAPLPTHFDVSFIYPDRAAMMPAASASRSRARRPAPSD